jgi:integrase
MLLAGLRPSEARALRIEHIDFADDDDAFSTIRVVESAQEVSRFTHPDEVIGETKTGVRRSVPIPPQLAQILREHIGERTSGLVAPSGKDTPVCLSNLDRSWERARTNKSWVPYTLRHVAATGWLRSGVSVAEVARRLGHSPEVLMRVYAGLFRDDVERANERIGTWLDTEW